MLKLQLLCLVLFLTVLSSSAQLSGFTMPQLLSNAQKNRTDSKKVDLLLYYGDYCIHRHGDCAKNSDTALVFFRRALQLSNFIHDDTRRNKALELAAEANIKASHVEQATDCLLQLIAYYQQQNNIQQQATHWMALGALTPDTTKANIQYKIECFNHSRTLFVEIKNNIGAAGALKNIAEVHMSTGNPDLAIDELNKVLIEYKTAGVKDLQATYMLLAEAYRAKVDLHEELVYRLEAVKSMEASADTTDMYLIYDNLAMVYADLSMYDQSIQWLDKSLHIMRLRRQYSNFYGNLSMIIYDFISEGKPRSALLYLIKSSREVPPGDAAQKVDMYEGFANCYVALKQYNQAEYYYLKMMEAFQLTAFKIDFYGERNEDQMYQDYIHYNQTMGNFYILDKKYEKAGKYLSKILQLPKSRVRAIVLSKIYEKQFQVDSALGNYVTSIKYFELHKRLDDSLFNIAKFNQIEDLQIKYETVKKEQSIKLLKSQGKHQQEKLEEANMQRNITFIGITMLLIVAGLAYKGYRNKQRSNMQLQAKQTEIDRQNKELMQLLTEKDRLITEKDWLLKEVHHRVKNNLQIVMSLLSTQSAYLKNNAAIAAISESQNRVQAISLIHQKLYSTNNIASIDMPSYSADLVNYLCDCFNTRERGIYFDQLVENIKLDLAQAIPLGLILNEAITNAIKYAFTTKGGEVIIALQLIGNDTAFLTIADNGKGLPPNFDIKSTTSLGMEMMKALSKQLGGDFVIRNKTGTVINIEFKIEKISHVIAEENIYI